MVQAQSKTPLNCGLALVRRLPTLGSFSISLACKRLNDAVVVKRNFSDCDESSPSTNLTLQSGEDGVPASAGAVPWSNGWHAPCFVLRETTCSDWKYVFEASAVKRPFTCKPRRGREHGRFPKTEYRALQAMSSSSGQPK